MTDERTPEQKAVDAEVGRFQAKHDAAPEGSQLRANMQLRIGVAKASLEEDDASRSALETAARSAHTSATSEIKAAAEADAA